MKLVIAGSRNFDINRFYVEGTINFLKLKPTEIVCGMCKTGVDNSVLWLAKHNNIPLKEYPADWDKHGRAAGPIRNEQMAKYGDALLLIWDGESKGSANMKFNMQKLNKPIYEVIIKGPN